MVRLRSADADKLRSEGYAHLSNAVELGVVDSMRRAAERFPFSGDGVGLAIGKTMAIPGLEKVVFSPKILNFARAVLGDQLSLFPNITLRRNSQTPWHVDDAFRLPFEGWEDADRISFLQVTVYLQDNSGSGGGLDVIPRSHRLGERAAGAGTIYELISTMLAESVTVPSVSGDAVAWDGRLMHRSTPWTVNPNEWNYGVHWTLSRKDTDRVRFFEHLVARGDNEKDTTGVDRRYGEMRAFSFKEAATEEFLRRAAAEAVTLFDARATGQQERVP